ncbi:MAG: hypothetical protein GC131_03900 [Alphaproteobacteria bacterium]|nr:hypothetical protein [Alphaproteobacteria bacterium]
MSTVYRNNKLDGKARDLDVFLVKLRQTTLEDGLHSHAGFKTGQDGSKYDELRINSLTVLCTELIDKLPEISLDMQQLLRSSWTGDCNGRLAADLFKGPVGTKNEGIGSGNAFDGMLPWVISNLLDREERGTDRPLRTSATAMPVAPDERNRRTDLARRWAETRTSHLRKSGGIE